MFFHIFMIYDRLKCARRDNILVETVSTIIPANIPICRGDMIYNAIAKLF